MGAGKIPKDLTWGAASIQNPTPQTPKSNYSNPRNKYHQVLMGAGKIPKDLTWGAAKKLMGNVEQFLNMLINFDKVPSRFRGGLVFKAHRLCVSLNSRLESNKEEGKNNVPLQTPLREEGLFW